jgi:transposase
VVIDHDNARVLEVLENRDKTTLWHWLVEARDQGLLTHLQEVTVDMWEWYSQAIHEVFGDQVQVVIDRFHVMKHFQDQLTHARREIQRRLPVEYRPLLKGSRWMWMSNLENLSNDQRKEFAALRRLFPQLKALFLHRQRLRRIFENRTLSVAQAQRRLLHWCEQGQSLKLRALDKFHKTVRRWIGSIANYFLSRASNGRTEGFNHGIRAILWRGYGMRNFTHFRLRVLHEFG